MGEEGREAVLHQLGVVGLLQPGGHLGGVGRGRAQLPLLHLTTGRHSALTRNSHTSVTNVTQLLTKYSDHIIIDINVSTLIYNINFNFSFANTLNGSRCRLQAGQKDLV